MDEIYLRHFNWIEKFPRIEPFYAAKSNYDLNVLKLFKFLNIGFDCSSKGEIERLIELNVQPDKILFANPNKQVSYIKFAHRIGVTKLVFDNENELLKIKRHHPSAECILRIKADSLPGKFGADRSTSMNLIKKCIELDLNLVGISFYVGFRQKTSENIIESIKNARFLFDYARENLNYLINILDIGGGFPGSSHSLDLFSIMARQINNVLDEYFPEDLFRKLHENSPAKFRIIAELGTYYTTSAYTLCSTIIGKKELSLTANDREKFIKSKNLFINSDKESVISDRAVDVCAINKDVKFLYSINDSIHGSFKWYDINQSTPIFIRPNSQSSPQNENYFYSSIGGVTCDSCDFIIKDCLMPEILVGDYVIFKNMGSYTKTAAVPFNDIPLPKTIFVSTCLYDIIKPSFDDKCRNINAVKYRNNICYAHNQYIYGGDLIDHSDHEEVTSHQIMESIFSSA